MIALSPSLRVYTIPPELPFVDALASGLMDRATDSSFDLVDFTILLPTRRAVRSLREAFLRLSNGSPLLLPRMMPLGDLDEEELVIAGWQELPVGLDGASEIEFPDAISSLQRHLMLTKRIQVLEGDKIYIDQAARLAIELGSLLDQVQTEQLNFFQLRSLVPDEYARHWQKTLKFLEILTEFWPEILKEKGLVDPAERRNLVMKTQLSHWINNPPQKPIIVAGSTGSIPATADLIQFIAGLPEGCVVLPGLDCSLETVSVEDSETHPQHGMQRLLAKMNLEPKNIQIWPNQKIANKIKSASTARSELIFKVMWPANKVDEWRSLEPPGKKALEGVENISCPGPDEEAGVIALKLREALEIKGKTASLITPDRRLARRVAAELGRWGVEIDDSAGIPLSQTPQGSFIQLTAKLVAHQFLPIDFLAVGKHPLAAGGKKPVIFRQFIRDVEVKALRGPRPALGIEGLLELVSDNRHDLRHMLEIIQDMSAVFRKVIALPQISLNDALIAHIAFVEALASTDVDSGRERLWTGDAGEAAGSFIAELMEVGNVLGNISAASYPALLEILMVSRIVRPSFGSHPRLAIWGLLEARLQHADLVILGGLNEGTWPPDVGSDPWMSRPMRKEFGLSSPERRIGLTAHDFQQAFCAPEVTITRSTRVDGAPTVPSRWLVRLDNFLSGLMGVENSILSGQNPWLYWQSMLDRPEGLPQSITPPKPKPPVEARPRQLSVTQVETWMRDPYAVYARHILGLRALPPIDSSPDAADYGSLIHNSLDEFSRLPPELLLENQLEKLIELGSKNFEPVLKYPSVWAFWWPRFLRIAEWYIDFEVNRRQEIISVHSEVYGELNIKGKVGLFKLTAKADRIDVLKDGGLRIIDYKTGMPPTKKEVAAGFAPQLPLEAAIAQEGRFFNITANRVNYLDYWRLGGGDPAGEEFSAGAFPADLAAQAKDGLEALVRLFDDEKTPYEARPRPEAAPKYSDYEHLARVKEWSSSEGEED
jgi:ATP-dependent helicase/nuclease subunit B